MKQWTIKFRNWDRLDKKMRHETMQLKCVSGTMCWERVLPKKREYQAVR